MLEPLYLHTRLTILWLHSNALIGTFSRDFHYDGGSVCAHLHVICLNITYFHSSIIQLLACSGRRSPGQLQPLANMTLLTFLRLSDNQLDGSLDPLAYMLNMNILDISRNRFNGTVCALARMTNIKSLAVGGNVLTGNVSCLRNLTALQVQLDISSNQLDGTLDILPSFPQLLILNASHNAFSGLVAPHVASAALTQLAVVDVSWNSFTDGIESLTLFANLRTSLTRLLLARNAFVGSRLLLDVERLPQLVELDLSNNPGVTGLLTQTAAPGRSMVLNAAGSTQFECPTPPFPSTMIVTLSACRQVYDGLLFKFGYAAAGAAAVGLIVYLTKGHQHPRFLRLAASGVWFASCLSFLNDGSVLLEMVTTVTGKTTNCDIVNHRGVFEVFLPLRDTSGIIDLRQGYIGPRGPYCYCGNTTLFPGERQLDLRVDPPPREQTFVEYMTVYTLWLRFATQMSPLLQRAAFRNLCLRFPRCNLAAGSDDQVCGDRYDDAWSNKDNFGFLVCVVTLLVWRGVLEALKLAVIVASFVEGRIVGREYAMPFLQSSPFLPLMGAFGVDWVGDVLRYQRTSRDHLRFFAVQGLLNVLPFLALQLYYVNVVQQTGLKTLSYVSMAINFVLVPVIVLRAGYALYQERTTRALLVASIVAHAKRSSTANNTSASVSTVDVELTSMSRDRSLTWRPLDLSSAASAVGTVAAPSGSLSEDPIDGGEAGGHVHPTMQSADQGSAAVASVHAPPDAVSLDGRVTASGVDAVGLLPAGALNSDSSNQI
jgi:hypothetical protein